MTSAWAFGVPGSGKTTLALARAAELAVLQNRPLLVIDAEGDPRTAIGRRASNPEQWLCDVRVGWRLHTWRALDALDQADAWAQAIERRGRVVVLLDGAHALLTAHAHAADPWVRLFRVQRHRELDLWLTSHHLGGDVPQVVQACAPTLYVFRVTSPAALHTLAREYRLDPARVAALPPGAYFRIASGFLDSA